MNGARRYSAVIWEMQRLSVSCGHMGNAEAFGILRLPGRIEDGIIGWIPLRAGTNFVELLKKNNKKLIQKMLNKYYYLLYGLDFQTVFVDN